MFLLTQKCENRLKLIFILTISSFLLLSCASDDGGSFVFGTPDTTPPTVSSTSPGENASADVDNNISVTFSEAMNPTTVTTNTDSTSCNGTIQVSSDNFSTCAKMSSSPIASNTKMKSKTFSVSPSQNLSYLTSYKIRVTDGPKDYSGNALESEYQMANGFTTYQENRFIAVGAWGETYISYDGTSWTSRTSDTSYYFYGVTYGNGTFVVVGSSGTILTSSQGNSWTSRTSGTSNYLRGVTYGNSTFVVVGSSGTILTSSDGTSWTSRTSDTSHSLYGVTYGNSTFVAVGGYGYIRTSSDGTSWTIRTSGSYGNGTSRIFWGVTSR